MVSSREQVVAIYSNSFNNSTQDSWYASPSPKLLSEIAQNSVYGYESVRYIATVKGPSGEIKVALGDPVSNTTRRKDLYVPHWLLASIGIEGVGEEMVVSFSRCEDYQKATKLCFQYLEEMPEGFDMRDLLETPLSQLGVLQKGQILPAPVLEGSLVVKHVEPEGGFVFLDGMEVEFEFESDFLPKALPEPSPQPTLEPPTSSPFLSGMLPASILPPTPPVQTGKRTLVKKVFPTSFVPFSGQGRTLGN